MRHTKDLVLRFAVAVGFASYFGVVILVELLKIRTAPSSVSMLVNRRGSGLQTEVRVDSVPIYVHGIEGMPLGKETTTTTNPPHRRAE